MLVIEAEKEDARVVCGGLLRDGDGYSVGFHGASAHGCGNGSGDLDCVRARFGHVVKGTDALRLGEHATRPSLRNFYAQSIRTKVADLGEGSFHLYTVFPGVGHIV